MKESQLYHKAIEQNLAPKMRVYRGVVRAKRRTYRLRRAALIAAACLVLAITTVFCIPETRAAVLGFLTSAVDPRDYLETPVEQRTSAPALDAAIEQPDTTRVTQTVTAAMDDAWREWAEALTVRFDELLYDGKTLYISGAICGNTPDLVKSDDEYLKEEDEQGITLSPPSDMVMGLARYCVNGGAWTRFDRSVISPPQNPQDVSAEVASGEAPMYLDLVVGRGLAGVQDITIEYIFCDMGAIWANADGAAPPEKAVLRVEGLTFDATAGTDAQNVLATPKPVKLAGSARIFSLELIDDSNATAGNDLLSLDGGQLAVLKMQQQLNGTRIIFHLTLPADWTKAQCGMFSDYFNLEFIIDGENQGGLGKTYSSIRYIDNVARLAEEGVENPPDVTDFHNICFDVTTGLMPEDWTRMQSFHALLGLHEMAEYNHVAIPTDARVTVPEEANGWSEETDFKRFLDCTLRIK